MGHGPIGAVGPLRKTRTLRGILSPPETSMMYTMKSASSREKLAARLSPPLSMSSSSHACCAESSSSACRFIEMSSRMAACGQPPVSMARMRSAGSAPCRSRKSPSSRVKMSLVTAAMLNLSRRSWHSASISAVLPVPTGPPMPTVNARRVYERASGIARSPNSPALGMGAW